MESHRHSTQTWPNEYMSSVLHVSLKCKPRSTIKCMNSFINSARRAYLLTSRHSRSCVAVGLFVELRMFAKNLLPSLSCMFTSLLTYIRMQLGQVKWVVTPGLRITSILTINKSANSPIAPMLNIRPDVNGTPYERRYKKTHASIALRGAGIPVGLIGRVSLAVRLCGISDFRSPSIIALIF